MAKKSPRSARTARSDEKKTAVTLERAARMYRLLQVLRDGPQTRKALLYRLRLDMRAFYRDLGTLRSAGIIVHLEGRHYHLEGSAADAIPRLPFPDPHLTLGDALILARGRTHSHRMLKAQVRQIMA